MTQPATQMPKRRRQIGKYRLIASLGQGGMAKVYLALMAGPAGFNKLLVIKALRDDMSAPDGDYVGMFLDEARLSAQLSHPNVVQTYEVGEADGRYFIAMEYLEGQSLRTVQRRLGPQSLPLPEQLRVLSEAARGLHYVHELRGFDGEPLQCVHRDVSPQNVFLTYDGQIKVLDFGIAKTSDPNQQTQVGVIKGKADYIAPEQVRSERVDRRADVFALGAMLWEALTGERFAGGPKVSDVTKIHNRVTGSEPSLAEVAPDAPEELRAICERALHLDPDERFQTAEELADALDGYLDGLSERPSRQSLAALVEPAFTADREKLRALIDAQVQLVQTEAEVLNSSTATLPSLVSRSQSVSRSGIQQTGTLPPSSGESGDHSWMVQSGANSLLPDLRNAMTPESGTERPDFDAPASGRGAPRILAIALAVLAVGVGAYLGVGERSADSPSDPTSPAEPASEPAPQAADIAVPVAPAPPAPATPEVETETETEPQQKRGTERSAASPQDRQRRARTVSLRISASPPDAEVRLDGALLPRLPFATDVVVDGTLHTLTASARGYSDLRQVITFDRDQRVELELQRAVDNAPDRSRSAADRPARSATSPSPRRAPPSTAGRPAQDRNDAQKSPQVIAPGQDLLGSSPARVPQTPKIDVEDPYQ